MLPLYHRLPIYVSTVNVAVPEGLSVILLYMKSSVLFWSHSAMEC